MTMHEKITNDMLEFFDKGTFKRHNLEYLIKELLQGDEQYEYLYSEYKRLKNSSADNDAIIRFLKKELIHKTSYKNVMKRQYRELKQKYEALKEKTVPPNLALGRLRKISYNEEEKYYIYEDEYGRKAKSFDGETWQDYKG